MKELAFLQQRIMQISHSVTDLHDQVIIAAAEASLTSDDITAGTTNLTEVSVQFVNALRHFDNQMQEGAQELSRMNRILKERILANASGSR